MTPTFDSQQVANEYREGGTMKSLARKYQCRTDAIHEAVITHGIPIRWGGVHTRFTPSQGQEIKAKYDSGLSLNKLAEEYETNTVTIRNTILRMGGSTRSRRVPGEGRKPRPRKGLATGERHHRWKGGRIIDGNGYVQIRAITDIDFQMCLSTGYVLEHRSILANTIGRPLLSSESVHHINGDRQDNRLENLQLRQGKHGTGVVYRCLDCGSNNVSTLALS